eukprot:7278630-Pyramimonas_sp.AAC.1
MRSSPLDSVAASLVPHGEKAQEVTSASGPASSMIQWSTSICEDHPTDSVSTKRCVCLVGVDAELGPQRLRTEKAA